MTKDETGALVSRAAGGDEQAWNEMVRLYRGLLVSVARGYRLDSAQVEDVVQTAWLRLYQRVGELREPEHVASWLVTTVRRECLALLRSRHRESAWEAADDACFGSVEAAEDEVVRAHECTRVRRALARLPERQRLLMTVLTFSPELNYAQVGSTLAMPIGSIGPTRSRALARLRELLTTESAASAEGPLAA